MKELIPILKHTQLFGGVGEEEIASMLGCLNARVKRYIKGEYVFRQGEYITDIALLAEGKLHIGREDYWGNGNIVGIIRAGEMFGEAYVAPDSEALLNNVVAVEDSTVVFLEARRILTVCSASCRHHTSVIRNLIFAISDKNRKLVRKLAHMSNRSIRAKLTSYLSEESERQKSPDIVVPFNRQQMADYLSVDRSAMSNELCKMRNEGLIKFEKNRFTLI